MPELWDSLNAAQQPQPAPDMWNAPMGVGSPAETAGAPSGMSNLASGLYQYLGNLAKRSFGASEEMRGGGAYNPAPAVETALMTMGGGVGGTGEGGVAVGSGPIRAYHSSPHDFDRFDLSKIGTGEGAQVYGHGLYFAENPAVSGQGGQYWQQFARRFDNAEGRAAEYLQQAGFDRSRAVEMAAKDAADAAKRLGDVPAAREYAGAVKLLTTDKPVGPRTYEVNINADPAHFLDWDKPLSAQPQVTDALVDAFKIPAKERRHMEQWQSPAWALNPGEAPKSYVETVKGGTKYGALAGDLGDYAAASAALRERGIPGIKYLDQGSRGPQVVANLGGRPVMPRTPTSNYVVFDPNRVDIMKKYGIAGAAPVGLAAGLGLTSGNEQRM